jgi:RNA polymerase sigma-32 factor
MRSDHCLQDASGAFKANACVHAGMRHGTETRLQPFHNGRPVKANPPYGMGPENQPLSIHGRVSPRPSLGMPATAEALFAGRSDSVQTQLSLKVDSSSLESYLKQIKQFPLLSHEEEFDLAARYRKENDVSASQILIESNLRFVVRVAFEFKSYGIKIADLIQEGNMGLIMAVRKFDPYMGYRLISYAVWWIRAYIQNFVMKNWSLVKIGTTQAEKKLFYKIGKVRKALETNQEEEGKYETVAKGLDVAKDDIIEMEQRMSSRDFSLDSPLEDGQEMTHCDLLKETSENQEEILAREEERRMLQKEIHDAMKQLNEKEEYVLRNRTLADSPLTLQEIGQHLNLSRERVRQIESEAIKKLKEELTPRIHWQS